MDTWLPILRLCMSAEFGNLNLKSSQGMYRWLEKKNVHTLVQYGPLHIFREPHKKVNHHPPIFSSRKKDKKKKEKKRMKKKTFFILGV